MTIFLEGIAAKFYRGIGPETQYIAPFSRMNFFIGANNAGKSIVLNLLASQLTEQPRQIEGPEHYRGRETGEFTLLIGRNTSAVANEIIDRHRVRIEGAGFRDQFLERQIGVICEKLGVNGHLWVAAGSQRGPMLYPEPDQNTATVWTEHWKPIWTALTGQGGGGAATLDSREYHHYRAASQPIVTNYPPYPGETHPWH